MSISRSYSQSMSSIPRPQQQFIQIISPNMNNHHTNKQYNKNEYLGQGNSQEPNNMRYSQSTENMFLNKLRSDNQSGQLTNTTSNQQFQFQREDFQNDQNQFKNQNVIFNPKSQLTSEINSYSFSKMDSQNQGQPPNKRLQGVFNPQKRDFEYISNQHSIFQRRDYGNKISELANQEKQFITPVKSNPNHCNLSMLLQENQNENRYSIEKQIQYKKFINPPFSSSLNQSCYVQTNPFLKKQSSFKSESRNSQVPMIHNLCNQKITENSSKEQQFVNPQSYSQQSSNLNNLSQQIPQNDTTATTNEIHKDIWCEKSNLWSSVGQNSPSIWSPYQNTSASHNRVKTEGFSSISNLLKNTNSYSIDLQHKMLQKMADLSALKNESSRLQKKVESQRNTSKYNSFNFGSNLNSDARFNSINFNKKTQNDQKVNQDSHTQGGYFNFILPSKESQFVNNQNEIAQAPSPSKEDTLFSIQFYKQYQQARNKIEDSHPASKIPVSLLFKEALELNIKRESELSYFFEFAFENYEKYLNCQIN